MPELPEVETVVRCLRPVLVGRHITSGRCSGTPLRRAAPCDWSTAFANPQLILAVDREGKWILVRFESAALLVHLGMSGRFQVVPAKKELEPHTHYIFDLAPGNDQLRFRDTRRFGSIGLLPTHQMTAFLSEKLGPDPFRLTTDALLTSLRQTERCLKAALLDQRILAGLGNIYVDEALHLARLHPMRSGNSLKRPEAERLRNAIVTVLEKAIEQKGSTIRDYFYDENGQASQGGYQNEFLVYQQTSKPCTTCGSPIRQTRLAGRSTHYCARCQRAPRNSN